MPPILFCTLYLDAFRDRLRLSLPVFLGGLAALQLVQAVVIEHVAGSWPMTGWRGNFARYMFLRSFCGRIAF